MRRHTSPWIPAMMIVASALMATLETVFLRWLGNEASQGQALLFRSGMQLLLAGLIGTIMTGSASAVLQTGRLRKHLWRGALAAFSWWCYYMSFKSLPLALATTLTFSSQLFVLVLVWPMLRERFTRAQLVTTLTGFLGVLMAAGVWDPMTLDWRVLYGLSSAFLGAVMILITRSLSFTDRTETIMFYMALVVFLSAIPQCLVDWSPLSARSFALLAMMAFTGTLGAWLMVEAYRYAEAAALAPYFYTRLIFAAGLGVWLFSDTIAPSTIAGALLIVTSNLVLLFFVSRSGKISAH